MKYEKLESELCQLKEDNIAKEEKLIIYEEQVIIIHVHTNIQIYKYTNES